VTADEFVAVARRLAPSPEEAALRDLSSSEVEQLARRFACTPRPGRAARQNVLEDLLNRYDVSALEIGRVELVSDPRPHWAGKVVAFFEADPLVLLRDGELAVFEQARFGERYLDCAADAGRLLAALACFAEGLRARAAWLDDLDAAARRCAALAGGARYEPFYVALCSVHEYGNV
jgi:hypothetical protein